MNQQQSHIFKISGELKKYIESNPRMFVTKLLCKLASIIPWHLLIWQFYAIYPWKAKRIIEIEKKNPSKTVTISKKSSQVINTKLFPILSQRWKRKNVVMWR